MMSEDGLEFRGPDVLQAATSRLVIVDVQEKLVRVMPDAGRLVAGCRQLRDGAELFQVPVSVTEQYPEGLGTTVSGLGGGPCQLVEKREFSAWQSLGWSPASSDPAGRYQVVVAGIEAHVCVLQTALELQSAGYRVFVVVDAIASRRETDRAVAVQRMMSAGITPVTAESVLFEWCERSDRPEFRALSQLVTQRAL